MEASESFQKIPEGCHAGMRSLWLGQGGRKLREEFDSGPLLHLKLECRSSMCAAQSQESLDAQE